MPHCREGVRALKLVAEKGLWFNLVQAAEAAYAAGDTLGAFVRYRMAAYAGPRNRAAS
jgi:hypothetical protein